MTHHPGAVIETAGFTVAHHRDLWRNPRRLPDDQSLNHTIIDPSSVCRNGLWRYSRHPNYFFEMVIWIGVYLFACGSAWGWTTFFAPVTITFLLLRVTGIPPTEKLQHSKERRMRIANINEPLAPLSRSLQNHDQYRRPSCQRHYPRLR